MMQTRTIKSAAIVFTQCFGLPTAARSFQIPMHQKIRLNRIFPPQKSCAINSPQLTNHYQSRWPSLLEMSRGVSSSPQVNFNVTLRPATPDDLDMLLKWDEQDYLKDEDVMGEAEYNEWGWEYELGREADIEWRDNLMAEYHGADDDKNSTIPIGVVQVIDPYREEFQYWGVGKDGKDPEYVKEFCQPNLRAIDIWIGEPAYLDKGLGSQMMQLALRDYCFCDPTVTAVLVDPMAANLDAIRFYQNKCGFEEVGPRQFGPDKCLVQKLERTRWEELQKNLP